MSQHDSEQDFLAKLYAQSAQEQPPAELDKRILQQAKAQHTHKRFARTLRWQRFVSVAAVMVLCVYIFFDMRHQHPVLMEEQILPQQKSLPEASPSAAPGEQLEPSEEQPAIAPTRQLKEQAAKRAAEPTLDDYAADEIRDSNTLPAGQDETPLPASQLFSSPEISAAKGMTTETNETISPDNLLNQITQLLKDGKQAEAEAFFIQLKEQFPDYPVPDYIASSFDKPEKD